MYRKSRYLTVNAEMIDNIMSVVTRELDVDLKLVIDVPKEKK